MLLRVPLSRDQMRPPFKRAGITFWHEWHGLGRGLVSNLHRLGVQDLVIQRVLRYSNVAMAKACDIKRGIRIQCWPWHR